MSQPVTEPPPTGGGDNWGSSAVSRSDPSAKAISSYVMTDAAKCCRDPAAGRELAARSENCEPDPSDELDAAAVTALRAAVMERSEAERHLIEAVGQARTAELSWSATGALVGTGGEATRQRYADEMV